MKYPKSHLCTRVVDKTIEDKEQFRADCKKAMEAVRLVYDHGEKYRRTIPQNIKKLSEDTFSVSFLFHTADKELLETHLGKIGFTIEII